MRFVRFFGVLGGGSALGWWIGSMLPELPGSVWLYIFPLLLLAYPLWLIVRSFWRECCQMFPPPEGGS
jgi:hypothetical protein